MERLVHTVMQHERKSDLLDRAVLAIGILSLCLALAATLFTGLRDVAAEDTGAVAHAAA